MRTGRRFNYDRSPDGGLLYTEDVYAVLGLSFIGIDTWAEQTFYVPVYVVCFHATVQPGECTTADKQVEHFRRRFGESHRDCCLQHRGCSAGGPDTLWTKSLQPQLWSMCPPITYKGLTWSQWLLCIGIASVSWLIRVILTFVPAGPLPEYGNKEISALTSELRNNSRLISDQMEYRHTKPHVEV